MRKIFPFIILLLYFSVISQTTITGDISGMTFKPSGNPWIIKENIFIENGRKTVIKPGCIFLFKPYSGIIIQGSLMVEGQPEAPVIFTSINDSSYNEASTQKAEPFDWNGIIIEKTAETVKMTNFFLSYSVFGLKSKKEQFVIDHAIFRQNGQFNFTVNDKFQDIESNLPFSYNISVKAQNTTTKSFPKWFKSVGLGTLATGTAFLGVMGFFIYSGVDWDRKYENSVEKNELYSNLGKRDAAERNAVITGITGGILVPAGAGILIWGNRTAKNTKTVFVRPIAAKQCGISFTLNF